MEEGREGTWKGFNMVLMSDGVILKTFIVLHMVGNDDVHMQRYHMTMVLERFHVFTQFCENYLLKQINVKGLIIEAVILGAYRRIEDA